MARRSPARLLAPVALAVTLFALFTIVTSGSGGDTDSKDGGSPAKATATATVTKKPARTGTSAGPKTYTVKAGDTPSGIAEATDVPLETLLDLNPNVDPQALSPGQKLKLRP